jgi:hypothetical protein
LPGFGVGGAAATRGPDERDLLANLPAENNTRAGGRMERQATELFGLTRTPALAQRDETTRTLAAYRADAANNLG